MAELTLVEAINDCFHVELARDENVLVMGEDVGRAGGVFRATAGLRDKYGPDRCVDTPLAEAGIMGTAIGLCMAGWRPVCEMQYDAFSYPALDQLITHVGRYRWRTGGKMEFPITVRMPYGGGVRAPELHDDSPEAYYVHTPGREGRDPVDSERRKRPARGGNSRSRSRHHLRAQAPLPDAARRGARGRARRPARAGAHVREGEDVTLVAYGSMVPLAEQAADAFAERASAEILDIRTLKPLDEDALLAAAAKTGRVVIIQEAPRTAGYGAELAAILAEKAMLDLRGPVLRVTGYDVPYRTGRSRTRTCRRSSGSWTRSRSCSSTSGAHELPLEQRYLHGHFSKDLEPAIEIDPGDSVKFFTPNHAWDIARDERFAPRSPELDEGHALAGPIFVRGAKAGQTLVVQIEAVDPAPGASCTEAGPRDSLGAGERRRPVPNASRSSSRRFSA